ncbi:MAG: hypothetical protein ACRD07_09160 [Acidimicrobiales bacterium]
MTITRIIRPRRLLVAVAAATALIVTMAGPASADVSNPGTFEATILDGSTIALTAETFEVGTSACEDGKDNDFDGNTDHSSVSADPDAECDSVDDANERLDGVQTNPDATITFDVDADGDITLDPADIVFPETELCTDLGFDVWCLGATIVGSGSSAFSGFIDPDGPSGVTGTGTISLPVVIQVDLRDTDGFPNFNDDCFIGPISMTLTSNDYNHTTGTATLSASSVDVPAVTMDCGSFIVDYNDAINDRLQLPDTEVAVTLLTDVDPPILP